MKQIRVILIAALFALALPLTAADSVDLIDSPTAATLERGFYTIGFYVYNGGGIYLRTMIGMTEDLTLGVSESVDYLIGRNAPVFHIPSVMVKFRIFGGPPDNFHLSVGFGPQTFSDIGYRFDKQVHSAYVVTQKGFNFIVEEVYQFVHLGIRYPLLPEEYRKKHHVNLYTGLNTRIGTAFEVKLEVENITFFEGESPIFNAGVVYHFSEMFQVEFDIQYMRVEDENHFNRMLKLNYVNLFY